MEVGEFLFEQRECEAVRFVGSGLITGQKGKGKGTIEEVCQGGEGVSRCVKNK